MSGTDALDQEAAAYLVARLALYRTLVAAIERLSLETSIQSERHSMPFGLWPSSSEGDSGTEDNTEKIEPGSTGKKN